MLAEAGARDEHVDAPEALDRARGHRLHIALVVDVEVQREVRRRGARRRFGSGGEQLEGLLEPGGRASDDREAIAATRQRNRDRLPDTAAAAGDDGDRRRVRRGGGGRESGHPA